MLLVKYYNWTRYEGLIRGGINVEDGLSLVEVFQSKVIESVLGPSCLGVATAGPGLFYRRAGNQAGCGHCAGRYGTFRSHGWL